jgi:hypothetical protein
MADTASTNSKQVSEWMDAVLQMALRGDGDAQAMIAAGREHYLQAFRRERLL